MGQWQTYKPTLPPPLHNGMDALHHHLDIHTTNQDKNPEIQEIKDQKSKRS